MRLRHVLPPLLALAAAVAATATAQEPARVAGTVTDSEGAPVPNASVYVEGTLDGAAADADGAYLFATDSLGPRLLRASSVGYRAAERPVTLVAGDTARVDLVLGVDVVSMGTVTVTAGAYTTDEALPATLSALDVVMTPGASADVFQAVKTFPGVAAVDEGAGLYVRGGDVSETVTLLDQATVRDPYKFESPTTIVHGTLPPFLVRGTAFSSGGFSARYGNAMSAVLEMQTRDVPERPNYYLNASVGANSVGVNLPVARGRLGVRASGNYSTTRLLFWMNGASADFSVIPRSADANGSLVYEYSDTGRLKLFAYGSTDRVGVRYSEPAYTGYFRGEQTNGLFNLQWTETLGRWRAQTSASYNRAESHQQFGALDIRPSQHLAKVRTDVESAFGTAAVVAFGAEVNRYTDAFKGQLPVTGDTGPGGEVIAYDERLAATLVGGYAEVTPRLYGPLLARAGLRVDYHSVAAEAVLDPRLTLEYVASGGTRARASWGLYHQFSDPESFNDATGNPGLGSQHAYHYVLGGEHERGHLLLRGEAYYKTYHDLVLADTTVNLANVGDGWARGLDLFARYGGFLVTPFSGHVSYSFLQSERRQVRTLGPEMVYETGPSPFDVTHNLTVVGKAEVVGGLTAGLTLRYATGHPVTPVREGVLAPDGPYYLPVEGPVGSERLPDFYRVDAQLTYYLPFGAHNAVFYVSVANLFDRRNVFAYEYAEDYSSRTEQATEFHRFFYVGATLNLNP